MRTEQIAVLAIGIALATGSPANAQTTQCRWVGNVWTCDQQRQSTVDWSRGIIQQDPGQTFMDAYSRARQQREAEERQRQLSESYSNSRAELNSAQQRLTELQLERETARVDVGRMLAAGDCQGAQSRALAAGEIELAQQAKSYCSDKPPPREGVAP